MKHYAQISLCSLLVVLFCFLSVPFATSVHAFDAAATLNIDGTQHTTPSQVGQIVSIISDERGVYIYSLDGYLWRFEHAAEHPQLLGRVCPPSTRAHHINGALWDGALYVLCDFALWTSDGTPTGTAKVLDLPLSEQIVDADLTPDRRQVFVVNLFPTPDNLFIFLQADTGAQLWNFSDGADGLTLLKHMTQGGTTLQFDTIFLAGQYYAAIDNTIYFAADDQAHGLELWTSDGTATGTRLVKDIMLGTDGAFIYDLKAFNGMLYFGATDGIHGHELWQSDGTATGTKLVKDINPGTGDAFLIPVWGGVPCLLNLHVVNDRLLFTAGDDVSGGNLWTSDGTAAGTKMLADVDTEQSRACNADFSGFTSVNDQLIFAYKADLFTTLDNGIEQLPAYLQEKVYSLNSLTAVGNRLFFIGTDSEQNDPEQKRGLWVSDLTENGTQQLQDFTPELLTVAGQWLYFIKTTYIRTPTKAFRDTTELWRSDGTSAGTTQIFAVQHGNRLYLPVVLEPRQIGDGRR